MMKPVLTAAAAQSFWLGEGGQCGESLNAERGGLQ